MIYEISKMGFTISTDKRKLRIKTIHNFLSEAYWSRGISVEKVKRGIKGACCFGVYRDEEQVGFARVVTDFVSFGYIADVFIIEKYRGRGLSIWLVKAILNHPELKGMKAWMLATKDAHALYAKFGFEPLEEPQKYMQRKNPNYFPKVFRGNK